LVSTALGTLQLLLLLLLLLLLQKLLDVGLWRAVRKTVTACWRTHPGIHVRACCCCC
jgi:hypothetical protein